MKNWINALTSQVHHLGVIGLFAVTALLFFYPVVQGKKMAQSDIFQYNAMAKERNDFRQTQHQESYWTDSAFGGMPTYQLGANYPYDFIRMIDKAIRFLPRPADYLFLYLVGFYLLLLTLRVDYKVSFLGAMAFGFSTYLIIILVAGHNAKAHSIGYFSWVLSGFLLVFQQRRYLWGGLFSALALALEIHSNHYQMTYYLLILCGILVLFQGIRAFYIHRFKPFFKALGVLALASLLAIWVNITPLLTTLEYTSFSTRGTSTLTLNPNGTPKTQKGLSKDYITEYSYGIFESLDLIVPRLLGGSNHERLGTDSHTFQFLTKNGVSPSQAAEFSQQLPTYWGNQPIVAAPAYIGIVVFFLFVLGIFIVPHRIKWWLVTGSLVSLWLSWGKNFAPLTDFMIEWIPLYDKFRAVSSIQVILELCVPVLAMLSLDRCFHISSSSLRKPLLFSSILVFSILLILWLAKPYLSFTGTFDGQFNPAIAQVIQADRKQMYSSDIIRAVILVSIGIALLALFQRKKIATIGLFFGFLLLISFDMIGVARRYVSEENFISQKDFNSYFTPSAADRTILKDTSRFRVFEPEIGLNGARTSYFHRSLGGYHAAKPRRIQELIEYLSEHKDIDRVFNLLNVKYFIVRDEKRNPQAVLNEKALGNAWFVGQLSSVKNDDEALHQLTLIDPKEEAIQVNPDAVTQHFKHSDQASIQLLSAQPNQLVYESINDNPGFAVFSEIFYPRGWKIDIDGKNTEMTRVDFLLRGLAIPEGKHRITFRFEPDIVQRASLWTLAGNITLIVLFMGAICFSLLKKNTTTLTKTHQV